MKVTLMALTGLLAAASFCACNNNDDNQDMSKVVNGTDSMFVMKAALGNTAEVQAANLALTKSSDTAVLNYANMMIADHTTAQTNLKNLVAQYGLTAPDSVDALHAQLQMQMSLMSGRTFDSMYMKQQVADHQATIQDFETETTSGNNVDLKSFATTTLPKLQMHLDRANSVVATAGF